MDAKFINRYNSYCSSLSALEKALTRDPSDEQQKRATAPRNFIR